VSLRKKGLDEMTAEMTKAYAKKYVGGVVKPSKRRKTFPTGRGRNSENAKT